MQASFDQFTPGKILVPIVNDRLPRFIRLMETTDLQEAMMLLSRAVTFHPKTGVTIAETEGKRPYTGELINGFLELLRVRAEEEGNLDFHRMAQEIMYALPEGEKFYGIGVSREQLLKGFNPDSGRSSTLEKAISRYNRNPAPTPAPVRDFFPLVM